MVMVGQYVAELPLDRMFPFKAVIKCRLFLHEYIYLATGSLEKDFRLQTRRVHPSDRRVIPEVPQRVIPTWQLGLEKLTPFQDTSTDYPRQASHQLRRQIGKARLLFHLLGSLSRCGAPNKLDRG